MKVVKKYETLNEDILQSGLRMEVCPRSLNILVSAGINFQFSLIESSAIIHDRMCKLINNDVICWSPSEWRNKLLVKIYDKFIKKFA